MATACNSCIVDRGAQGQGGGVKTASDCVLLTVPLRRMPAYIAAYVALIGTRNGPTSDAVGLVLTYIDRAGPKFRAKERARFRLVRFIEHVFGS